MKANFEALKIKSLPHFLVVYRSIILPDNLRELLKEENALCEIKNAEPLHSLTIKSLIGCIYDDLWADGKSVKLIYLVVIFVLNTLCHLSFS